MKKISITNLESARTDPKGFAETLKAGGTGQSFGGRAKFIRWQDSVNHYHKTNSLEKSIAYFNKSFSSYVDSAKNRREQEFYFNRLNDYILAVKKRRYKTHTKENIKIELNSKLTLSGRVPLVFKTREDKYSVYLFTKNTTTWETELRFPVLQNYFGEVFETETKSIEVGVFSLSDGKFHEMCYATKQIKKALEELDVIGKTIYDLI